LLRKLLKAKIHNATVTGADLEYEGSISIDKSLLEAVDMVVFEAVHVWNVSNGQRIETYVIEAEHGSGEICLNGAAARLFEPGDKVIIASFCWTDEKELPSHQPKVIIANSNNGIARQVS